MSKLLGYVITYKKKKKLNFLSRNYRDTYVLYWDDNIKNAIIFENFDKAFNMINSTDFNSKSKDSNGIVYPASILRDAIGLCKQNPKGKVDIVIRPLKVAYSFTKKFKEEIKTPIGFKY